MKASELQSGSRTNLSRAIQPSIFKSYVAPPDFVSAIFELLFCSLLLCQPSQPSQSTTFYFFLCSDSAQFGSSRCEPKLSYLSCFYAFIALHLLSLAVVFCNTASSFSVLQIYINVFLIEVLFFYDSFV